MAQSVSSATRHFGHLQFWISITTGEVGRLFIVFVGHLVFPFLHANGPFKPVLIVLLVYLPFSYQFLRILYILDTNSYLVKYVANGFVQSLFFPFF